MVLDCLVCLHYTMMSLPNQLKSVCKSQSKTKIGKSSNNAKQLHFSERKVGAYASTGNIHQKHDKNLLLHSDGSAVSANCAVGAARDQVSAGPGHTEHLVRVALQSVQGHSCSQVPQLERLVIGG